MHCCFCKCWNCIFYKIIKKKFTFSNPEKALSSFITIVTSCFLVGVPAIVSEFLYRYRTQAVKNKIFRSAHSSYIMGFRVKENIMNLMYYPIFMFRRLTFAATIVILHDYPEIQLAFINIGTIAFAGYMIYWKPFKNKLSLYSAASSELFFALFTSLLYTFKIPRSDYTNMIIGWVLISTVLVSLATSWVCIAFQQIRNWKRLIKLKAQNERALSLSQANECKNTTDKILKSQTNKVEDTIKNTEDNPNPIINKNMELSTDVSPPKLKKKHIKN